jgi:hypothetical protein
MARPHRIDTLYGSLIYSRLQAVPIHRVGYQHDPWAWTPWEYAGADGRFHGRWDDPNGTWRTIYVGSTALACYLEVLARFRPDPVLVAELAGIDRNDADAFPTAPAGELP